MPSSALTGAIRYEVDLADRITAVSESWTAFALANEGAHLCSPTIVGSDLWSAISDPATRSIYRTLVGQVRAGGGPASFRFRCDSPTMRRELEMRIAALGDGAVSFTTALLREQQRHHVSLLDPTTDRTDALVVVCGWCARIRLADERWVEVEEAVRMLRLFEQTALPRLSHGICPPCSETFMRALDGPAGQSPRDIVLGALPPG